MGTFVGHLVPGLALALLGLWHVINTIRLYCLKGSTGFTAKFWYPLTGRRLSKLKHMELVFVLCFSLLVILLQILDYPSFRFVFKLDNFEHAAMFLHLAIFAGFTLSAELTRCFDIVSGLSGLSGVLAASVFGQELFLLHFHSTDHVGLEGHYHWLLQLVVLVSLVASVAATCVPTSFPVALVLSISVLFQGCWFINMGFILWVPEYVPRGCVTQLAHAGGSRNSTPETVMCTSTEAYFRARALANLQFSWILSVIMIFVGCACLILARKPSLTRRLTEYEQLQSRGGDSPIVVEDFVKSTI